MINSLELVLVAAAIIGFAVTFIATPLLRLAAPRWNLVDNPDQLRKDHSGVIPLGGGLAVLIGFGVSVVATMLLSSQPIIGNWQSLLVVFSASVFICGIGLLDDLIQIRGRQKLAGQIVTSLILVLAGLRIESIEVFGWEWELGIVAIPFSMLWLLAAMNAMNLMDGMDGLATVLGIILCAAMAAICLMSGKQQDALFAVAMVGALFAFLVYNRPPASIFLGDAGSMFIGLLMGVLAIRVSLKGGSTMGLAVPVAIWTIPIFDVVMAIIRRKLTGRSIYATDHGHLHHCLLRKGYSRTRALCEIGGLCCITAIGALFSAYHSDDRFAVISCVTVLLLLIFTRHFGHEEAALLIRHCRRFLNSLVNRGGREDSQPKPFIANLHGDPDWGDLWESVTVFAERFDLIAVSLHIEIPSSDCDYHAIWNRRGEADVNSNWSVNLPFLVDELPVGHLSVSGASNEGLMSQWVGDLLIGLKPIEIQFVDAVTQYRQIYDSRKTQLPVEAAKGVTI